MCVCVCVCVCVLKMQIQIKIQRSMKYIYIYIYLFYLILFIYLFFRVLSPKLRSDKLTVFKCFRVAFASKKKTIQIPLLFNLYFQQERAPKLSICHLSEKRSVWVFDITKRRNDFSNFKSYDQVVMYLFNSLAKSCTLFWKCSEAITEIILLS